MKDEDTSRTIGRRENYQDCARVCAKLLQLCLTLCDPEDCSLPGSSVRGILQARILDWVAISSSRGSFQLKDQTCVFYVSCINRHVLYQKHHLGSPKIVPKHMECKAHQFSLRNLDLDSSSE